LLAEFGAAGDHNMAVELLLFLKTFRQLLDPYTADIARCICIRAQRPIEQAKEDIKDMISGYDSILEELSASRKVHEGDDDDEVEDVPRTEMKNNWRIDDDQELHIQHARQQHRPEHYSRSSPPSIVLSPIDGVVDDVVGGV
jgi:hypothetical protein